VPNLVFSQPMSSAAEVADAVLECIEQRTPEVVIRVRAATSRPSPTSSQVARAVRPLLEKKGARAKRVYVQRRARGT